MVSAFDSPPLPVTLTPAPNPAIMGDAEIVVMDSSYAITSSLENTPSKQTGPSLDSPAKPQKSSNYNPKGNDDDSNSTYEASGDDENHYT